jgi:hypothetical protein
MASVSDWLFKKADAAKQGIQDAAASVSKAAGGAMDTAQDAVWNNPVMNATGLNAGHQRTSQPQVIDMGAAATAQGRQPQTPTKPKLAATVGTQLKQD